MSNMGNRRLWSSPVNIRFPCGLEWWWSTVLRGLDMMGEKELCAGQAHTIRGQPTGVGGLTSCHFTTVMEF